MEWYWYVVILLLVNTVCNLIWLPSIANDLEKIKNIFRELNKKVDESNKSIDKIKQVLVMEAEQLKNDYKVNK